jgi:hypothetical protein
VLHVRRVAKSSPTSPLFDQCPTMARCRLRPTLAG